MEEEDKARVEEGKVDTKAEVEEVGKAEVEVEALVDGEVDNVEV